MKENRRRFEAAEYAERVEKTRRAMAAKGMDFLIVSDPSNMCWLTGYDAWSFYVHQCVVVGLEGELLWFGRGIDMAGAALTTDLPESGIHCYPDECVQSPDSHPMEYLADLLKPSLPHRVTIGLEKDNYYFSGRALETLYAKLPDARFVDATALVNWQRAVKSAHEIEYLRGAGAVIGKVYQRIMEVAEPGMAKNALAAEILHAATLGTDEHFGDYTAIVPLIGAGDEAAACHTTWDGAPLAANEGMFLELAGAHARYHCPVSRTLYLGEPTPAYRDVEQIMQTCFEETLPMFKPGNTCGEVADAFFNALERQGHVKDNRCGYAIGLSYPPDWGERTMSLRRTDTTVLEENMSLHFMPGLWFDDWGFEMTESVIVTERGAECLAQVPRELLVKS